MKFVPTQTPTTPHWDFQRRTREGVEKGEKNMKRSFLAAIAVAVALFVVLAGVGGCTPAGTVTVTPTPPPPTATPAPTATVIAEYQRILHCDEIKLGAGTMYCVHNDTPTWGVLERVTGDFVQNQESDFFLVTLEGTQVIRVVRKNNANHTTDVIFQRPES